MWVIGLITTYFLRVRLGCARRLFDAVRGGIFTPSKTKRCLLICGLIRFENWQRFYCKEADVNEVRYHPYVPRALVLYWH